jgi:RNA polymerase-binding transcription factor DksA
MLTDPQLAAFRDQLVRERARLQRSIHALEGEVEQLAPAEEAESGGGNDPADVGTEIYEQERTMTMERNEQALLDDIQAALVRLDEGRFGRCPCGQAIAVERRALPFAQYCITCQAAIERRRR